MIDEMDALITCNREWRGPRGDVPFKSIDVDHVCGLLVRHSVMCRCACGATSEWLL